MEVMFTVFEIQTFIMPYLQKLKPDYTDDLEKASINRRYQSSKVEIFEAEENL